MLTLPGNQMYRDWAWDAFVAINATCRVGNGFSSISNVNIPGGGSFNNEQESFLFAEVMKYSYLIQTTVSLLHQKLSFIKPEAGQVFICTG